MIITETQVVNNTSFNHLYSDQGYYLRRDDDKLFVDVLEETTSKHTYTETNIIAPHSLLSRVATLESKHNTLESKHNTLESKPHIIETYVNGTSWYRLYSDKWLVQSGIVSCTHNVSVTVNLFKNYKDTNYTCFCCPLRQAQDIWGHGDTITERNIDTFKLYVNNSVGNYDESWITYGYSP